MEPQFHSGSYVLVQRIPNGAPLQYGEIGAFIVGNQLYIRLQTDHQIVAYNFAAEGMGCTFVSRALARRLAPDKRLCFYACDPALSRQTISLFTKKNRLMTRAMEEFLRTVLRSGES